MLVVLGATVLAVAAGLPAPGVGRAEPMPDQGKAAPQDPGSLDLRGTVAITPRLTELTVFNPVVCNQDAAQACRSRPEVCSSAESRSSRVALANACAAK